MAKYLRNDIVILSCKYILWYKNCISRSDLNGVYVCIMYFLYILSCELFNYIISFSTRYIEEEVFNSISNLLYMYYNYRLQINNIVLAWNTLLCSLSYICIHKWRTFYKAITILLVISCYLIFILF